MIFNVAALALSALAVAAQSTSPSQTIVQNLNALNATAAASGKNYSIAQVLSLAGTSTAVVNALNATGSNLTLFAPTDAAFTAFGTANPSLLNTLASNATLLQNALFYHVIPGVALSANGAPAKQYLQTAYPNNYIGIANVGNTTLSLIGDNYTATVIDSIPSSNGVVYIVDTVLASPRTAPAVASANGLTTLVDQVVAANLTAAITGLQNATLFAPTNAAFNTTLAFAAANNLTLTPALLQAVLEFHVIPGVYFSQTVMAVKHAQLATLLGQTVNVTYNGVNVTVIGAGQQGFMLSAANVIVPDVLISGGVAHVIDAVLLPNLTAAASAPAASTGSSNSTGSSQSGANVVSASAAGVFAAIAAVALAL